MQYEKDKVGFSKKLKTGVDPVGLLIFAELRIETGPKFAESAPPASDSWTVAPLPVPERSECISQPI